MSKYIKVGITHGDFNGIGYEVIIKALDDERITELFTPVIFGSARAMKYYREMVQPEQLQVRRANSAAEATDGSVWLVDCVTGDVRVEPGVASRQAGVAALQALKAGVQALKEGEIDVLVTAPIDKSSIHGDDFDFPGHTEWLEHEFADTDPDGRALMILFSGDLRVALVTTHVAVAEVASHITKEKVEDTVRRMNASLRRDFRVERPRIAVLGLNPHCGDHGVAGTEDDTVVAPAVQALRADGIMTFGPFAADGFFGSGLYRKYDGVVAMYHDQGLAPFKALAGQEGVNYTAGLKYVRTSPDHGTGYDIAGRGEADPLSMRQALYAAADICRARRDHDKACANPLRPADASHRNQHKNKNRANADRPAPADAADSE